MCFSLSGSISYCVYCDAGVINTPLLKYMYGEGYVGSLLKFVGGVAAWFFYVKTPAQGAATTITAAVSPDLESHAGVCTDSASLASDDLPEDYHLSCI